MHPLLKLKTKDIPVTVVLDPESIYTPTGDKELIMRSAGNLAGRGYYLSTACDWIIGMDDTDTPVLIRLYKHTLSAKGETK